MHSVFNKSVKSGSKPFFRTMKHAWPINYSPVTVWQSTGLHYFNESVLSSWWASTELFLARCDYRFSPNAQVDIFEPWLWSLWRHRAFSHHSSRKLNIRKTFTWTHTTLGRSGNVGSRWETWCVCTFLSILTWAWIFTRTRMRLGHSEVHGCFRGVRDGWSCFFSRRENFLFTPKRICQSTKLIQAYALHEFTSTLH